MIFEGHQLPDNINWSAQLDQVFSKPYDVWYGDARPLDWVVRYAKQHANEIPAIAAALKSQLQKNDADIRGQIFEQAPYLPCDLSATFANLLVRERAALQHQSDPYREGQSLLGSLVRALDRRSGEHVMSDEAVRILSEILAPEDGFPESFLIALRANFDASLPSLESKLEKLSGEALESFARKLADLPSAQCQRAFETIGQSAPGYLRKRVATAIKKHVQAPSPEEIAAYRAVAQPGWPEPNTEDRWPQFATWLRV